MTSFKVRYISDNIHGIIPYSGFIERYLLGHPLFNRLQNIKQNSTAFKTYPTLEHSRFSHSLGVMNFSTKLFRAGILNGSKTTTNEFLSLFSGYISKQSNEIKNLITTTDFYVAHFDNDDAKFDQFKASVERCSFDFKKYISEFHDNDPIYSEFIIEGIVKDNKFEYNLALQSLRLAALLHDIGHPPFSHAAEFAFQDFYKENAKLNSDHEFYKIYNAYLQRPIDFGYQKGIPFHENVGLVFIEYIFDSILPLTLKEIQDADELTRRMIYFFLIKASTLSVLTGFELGYFNDDQKIKKIVQNETESFFNAMKMIISSHLDADRLDYLMRDGINSGFSKQQYNFERLIKSFALIKREKGNKQIYLFCPSVRALNDVEKFFKERVSIYKYIILHHNVVKTDMILSRTISQVLKICVLKGEKGELSDIWKNFWKLIELTSGSTLIDIKKFNNRASLWNENWFNTAINQAYNYLFEKRNNGGLDNDERYLNALLHEIHFNQRNLLSLWKKNHSYRRFVELYWEKYLNDFKKNPPTSPKKNQILSSIDSLFKITPNANNDNANPEETSEIDWIKEKNKFKLIKYTLMYLDSKKINIEEELENSLGNYSVEKKYKFFVKSVYKRLNSGIDNKFEITCSNDHLNDELDVVELSQVSSLISELNLSGLSSPQMYIYFTEYEDENYKFNKPEVSTEEKFNGIIEKLADTLFKLFKSNT